MYIGTKDILYVIFAKVITVSVRYFNASSARIFIINEHETFKQGNAGMCTAGVMVVFNIQAG